MPLPKRTKAPLKIAEVARVYHFVCEEEVKTNTNEAPVTILRNPCDCSFLKLCLGHDFNHRRCLSRPPVVRVVFTCLQNLHMVWNTVGGGSSGDLLTVRSHMHTDFTHRQPWQVPERTGWIFLCRNKTTHKFKSAKYAGGRASALRCCVVEWGVERASGATSSTSRSSGTSLANTNQNQDRKPDKTNHTSERVARLSGYRSCRETQSSGLEKRTQRHSYKGGVPLGSDTARSFR